MEPHKGARHSARLCGSIIKSTSHHKANEHHGLATPFCAVVVWLECGPAGRTVNSSALLAWDTQSCNHTKKFLRRTLYISLSGHTCTSPTQCKTSLSQVCGVRKVARTTRNATCKASEGVQMGWAGCDGSFAVGDARRVPWGHLHVWMEPECVGMAQRGRWCAGGGGGQTHN